MDEKRKNIYRPLIENLKNTFARRLKTVVLFGSQARSKTILPRDHDIFVVIENLSENPLQRLKEVRKTILDVPLEVNFIAKTPEEVDKNLTPLMLEIIVDGICLYGEKYFEKYRQPGLQALKQSGLKRVRIGKGWYWKFDKVPERNWELNWDGYHEFS